VYKTIVKISDDVIIDFGPFIDEVVEKDCRDEAKEIISKVIGSDDLTLIFEVLKLYVHYIEKNIDAFNLHLSYLKFKLVKNNEMNEGGCFSPE